MQRLLLCPLNKLTTKITKIYSILLPRALIGKTSNNMKQLFLFISITVIGIGLYLKYYYDVPDAQATVNFFSSGFFIIVGIGSLLTNIFWNDNKDI